MKNTIFKFVKLFCIALLGLFTFNVNLYADTVNGNGYLLGQTIAVPAFELEGNGYSAVQSVVAVPGELEGNGYSAEQVPQRIIAENIISQNTNTTNNFSKSNSAGGRLAYVVYPILDKTSTKLIKNKVITDSKNKNTTISANNKVILKLEELKSISLTTRSSLDNLYKELGSLTKSELKISNLITSSTVASDVVNEVFNSKVNFSLFSVALIVLLLISLGVSVFGYQSFPKIAAFLIGVFAFMGYILASDIYILPAVASLFIFTVLFLRNKEHEVFPFKKEEQQEISF